MVTVMENFLLLVTRLPNKLSCLRSNLQWLSPFFWSNIHTI
uniref:Uncharacterized protein n=1 Tax=Rhizophora mucronata TaxID=61149 RepID=A0A2P2LDG5_RHIMU